MPEMRHNCVNDQSFSRKAPSSPRVTFTVPSVGCGCEGPRQVPAIIGELLLLLAVFPKLVERRQSFVGGSTKELVVSASEIGHVSVSLQ